MRNIAGLLLCISLCAALACDNSPRTTAEKPEVKTKQSRWAKGSKAAADEKGKARAVPREGATSRPGSRAVGYSGDSATSSPVSSRSEAQAIDQIGKSIRESLEVGPTLVVWVFDRSESAARLATSAISSIKTLYNSKDFTAAEADDKLLTAIVGFDEKTDFLLDPPQSGSSKVNGALESLKSAGDGREATFTALKLTLEKYLPLRTKDRREVILAVVTDEPGDDLAMLDEVVAMAQKNAIPVFVVGPSAPLGKATSPEPPMGSAKPSASGDPRTNSADSYFNDWVSFDSGGYGGATSYDSGLGPWGLERVGRESGGAYLAVGSIASTTYGTRIDPAVMSKYAPDYSSLAALEKSLKENKCREALIAAAKLPASKTALLNPQLVFPKRNEAEMKRMLDKAQLDAARLEESVNKVYVTLAGDNNAIESDRANLTGARWQAAYDTALGRAAAAKIRIEGYNAMLAALKRGKSFEKPESTTWLLETADTIETGSSYQKVADKAKTYLERVVKEHTGTPWARVAEEELRTPLGWRWREQ